MVVLQAEEHCTMSSWAAPWAVVMPLVQVALQQEAHWFAAEALHLVYKQMGPLRSRTLLELPVATPLPPAPCVLLYRAPILSNL